MIQHCSLSKTIDHLLNKQLNINAKGATKELFKLLEISKILFTINCSSIYSYLFLQLFEYFFMSKTKF